MVIMTVITTLPVGMVIMTLPVGMVILTVKMTPPVGMVITTDPPCGYGNNDPPCGYMVITTSPFEHGTHGSGVGQLGPCECGTINIP